MGVRHLPYHLTSTHLPPSLPPSLHPLCFLYHSSDTIRRLHFTAFFRWELGIALFKRGGQLGQARVISHLVKITGAVNAPAACRECQHWRDWQLDGGGSICMAFSWAGNGHP